jgi:hypothetical protein
MICLVDLQGTFNTLYETKEDSQEQNAHCNPESVPHMAISPVVPPLRQSGWSRFIEGLLQDNESIVPVLECLDLSVLKAQFLAVLDMLINHW